MNKQTANLPFWNTIISLERYFFLRAISRRCESILHTLRRKWATKEQKHSQCLPKLKFLWRIWSLNSLIILITNDFTRVQKNFVNSTRIMYKEIKRTLKFYNTYLRRSIEWGDDFYGNWIQFESFLVFSSTYFLETFTFQALSRLAGVNSLTVSITVIPK